MVWVFVSFFTLNPHDIRSPITMSLLQDDIDVKKTFSLNVSDAEVDDYYSSFLSENPRRLHEAVASNPMAATLCFHWTVRLVIATLLSCDDRPGVSLDSIAAHETPGIFGYVRGYMGVVEPQMRKALRVHMPIQALEFSHPEDIFRSKGLPDIFAFVVLCGQYLFP